jgi:hypothetical protein
LYSHFLYLGEGFGVPVATEVGFLSKKTDVTTVLLAQEDAEIA